MERALAHLLPADLLLVGEQHDAADHQRLQRQLVQTLAARGQLAALALEMADAGNTTAALAPDAPETAVQAALRWNDAGWPWRQYGPVVMAAVRAGVPVLGANLPRERNAAAMADATLDARVSPGVFGAQQQAVRTGHCDLLPASRIPAMARVQIGRDVSMADTLAQARRSGQTVLLVAGGAHVSPALGVPLHLPSSLRVRTLQLQAGTVAADATQAADWVWTTAATTPADTCAELRQRLQKSTG